MNAETINLWPCIIVQNKFRQNREENFMYKYINTWSLAYLNDTQYILSRVTPLFDFLPTLKVTFYVVLFWTAQDDKGTFGTFPRRSGIFHGNCGTYLQSSAIFSECSRTFPNTYRIFLATLELCRIASQDTLGHF